MHLGGNLAQLSRYTTLLPVNTCEMERAAKTPVAYESRLRRFYVTTFSPGHAVKELRTF